MISALLDSGRKQEKILLYEKKKEIEWRTMKWLS